MADPAYRLWTNKKGRAPIDAWVVPHMVGPREANGTFLLKTPRGNARVHVGAVVIERKGAAWTTQPGGEAAFIRELEDDERGSHDLNPVRVGHYPKSLEADVAPRDDDTDDITRAIRSQAPAPAPSRVPPYAPPARPAAAVSTSPATKFRFLPQKGRPPSIEMRPPAELLVDDSYQRSIETGPSRKLIAQIARDWDWRLCVPLMVSKRDDGLYVIDGQHRLSAAKARGDIQYLPCCISTYDSPADEARMFVAANRSRRAVNHLDDFHAAIVADDERAAAIQRIVTDAGLRVSRKTGKMSWVPGEVTFTAAIRNVSAKHGEKLATDALTMIAEAFPGEVLSNGSSVFTALTSILVTPPDGVPIDRNRLFRALLAENMRGWGSYLTGCKGGDDRRRAMREAILMRYQETKAEVLP